MKDAMDDILGYRAVLARNRETFLLNHKLEFCAFDEFDHAIPRIAGVLGRVADKENRSYFQFIPFLQIMQRQARNAFENISAYQSYQAWVTLRPFVEASLIVGKWMDDPHNAEIWMSRGENKNAKREYQDTYSGKGLLSKALPHAKAIRAVLTRINDEFMHTNPRYYTGAITFSANVSPTTSGYFIDYTDNQADHRAHLHAFLHLLYFTLDSVVQMLVTKYGENKQLAVDLPKLEREFQATVAAIARSDQIHRRVLINLGLWSNRTLESDK